MPEGDTIYRTAARLRPVLVGHLIAHAESRLPQMADHALAGTRVMQVEARGKHLLIHLEDGRVIHSHMGMTGSWHVYHADQVWRKPARNAHLVLMLETATCVCFTPKTLELLSATQVRRHRYLAHLGPDLLDDAFDIAHALQRFRQHDSTPLGAAVMNQTLVCGIGNVYKSEVLFLEQLDPFAPVAAFADETIRDMLERSRKLMRKNQLSGPRRTRFGNDGFRLWVYGRRGEPCLKCGTRIEMRRQGDLGRSTYWCPSCQGTSDRPREASR